MSKGWEPARLVFRSEMRTHRAGAVLLVVVIAVASGVAIGRVRGRSPLEYGL